MNSKDIIQILHLEPHPEGGYFRETYRANECLTRPDGKTRNVSTAIYYLLEDKDISHFHRIDSDEIWLFHSGKALEIFSIVDGSLIRTLLGNQLDKGEVPQSVIPANTWFAARVKGLSGYALVSCTVAPGFDFACFELANREDLIQKYPDLQEIIQDFS